MEIGGAGRPVRGQPFARFRECARPKPSAYGEAFLGQLDRRSHDLVPSASFHSASAPASSPRRFPARRWRPALSATVSDRRFPVGVEEHVAGRLERRRFAIVDGDRLAALRHVTSMKPPPPRFPACGSVTASANPPPPLHQPRCRRVSGCPRRPRLRSSPARRPCRFRRRPAETAIRSR